MMGPSSIACKEECDTVLDLRKLTVFRKARHTNNWLDNVINVTGDVWTDCYGNGKWGLSNKGFTEMAREPTEDM